MLSSARKSSSLAAGMPGMAEVARREHPGFAYEVADLRKLPFAGRLPVDALKLGGDRRGFDRLVAWKPAAG